MRKSNIIIKKVRNLMILSMAVIVIISVYFNISNSRAKETTDIVANVTDETGEVDSQKVTLVATGNKNGNYEISLPETISNVYVSNYKTLNGDKSANDKIVLSQDEVENKEINLKVNYDKKNVTSTKTNEEMTLYKQNLEYDDKGIYVEGYLAKLEIFEKDLKIVLDEIKVAENSTKSNNNLIISEIEGKVYLPYTKEELNQKIQKANNANIDEVIAENFVVPIEKYKNSIRSRYHEGYNLMRNKEKKSKKQAILLGLELMFEFNLHPAIITACQNLEQLDIYLDCLEDNELEKFSCFKVIYKVLPKLKNEKNVSKLEKVHA